MKHGFRFAITVMAAGMAWAASARGADVHTILATPRQRIQTADYRATGRLVRVEANGARNSYGIAIKAHWFPGVLRVELEIASPSSARAHILFEMRPNGKDAIQIMHPGDKEPSMLPFDKWSDGPLGAGFSYEDFLEPQYFWPGQSAFEETKYGSRDCDVLKSVPGAEDKTHYAEIRTWLDHGIGFPVYAEKTMKGSRTVKEFTYFGLRQNGGVWSASQVEVKVRGQAGSTLLIIDRGSAKANLGIEDFKISHFQDGP